MKTPKRTVAKKATKTAATKTAKADVAKVETVTLKHLGTTLAETHNLPKKQVNEMLAEMIDMIGTHLKKGKKIRIAKFGTMQVRKRPARMGRNPATGEQIKIKASKKVAFRVAKELKEMI
ncbi:MAG: HU family DNA-binding protein [Hyphomicrobiaceae bacterium]